MSTHADKTQENKRQSVANVFPQKKGSSESTFQFVDNRSDAVQMRKLQEMANNHTRKNSFQFVDNRPVAVAQRKLQEMANHSPRAKQAAQLQAIMSHYSLQQQQPFQKKENNTGLPDILKTGIENLSGYSMDDVKVHYNSDKPSQLQAHAYAQGTNIHLGPGQEKHLPHEAWHVVQQKQGRVKPTMQMKDKVSVNDDAVLEREADVMGAESLSVGFRNNYTATASPTNYINNTQLKSSSTINVVQAYKLVTPKNIKDKLLELKAYTETEADSISKEFPSWHGKNKIGRLRDHDFVSDSAFLGMIREMITTVDNFTDEQGFSLRDKINSSDSPKIFLGYNAGNAAYAADMEKNGLKSKKRDSGLKADMQLSHGHYISPSRSELDSYIAERTFSGKDAVVYKVYLDLRNAVNFPIMMKGASVMQWWSNYDTSFDDDYDIVVAALSGHTDIIQYKINPKSYHLVTFEVAERHAKEM